jgi:hypothetical protein
MSTTPGSAPNDRVGMVRFFTMLISYYIVGSDIISFKKITPGPYDLWFHPMCRKRGDKEVISGLAFPATWLPVIMRFAWFFIR